MASTLSDRLRIVFGKAENQEVADRLAAHGFATSAETVRKARAGLTQRIDAEMVAATYLAYGADPAWLLTGEYAEKPPSQEERPSDDVVPLTDADRRRIARLADALLGALPLAHEIREVAAGPLAPTRPDEGEGVPMTDEQVAAAVARMQRDEQDRSA